MKKTILILGLLFCVFILKAQISLTIANIHNISCYGGNDGSITINVSGGTQPYSFIWSNNATTQNLNNLPYGTYIITVTDFNSNVVSDTIDLIQPPALSLSVSDNQLICNGDPTLVSAVVIGGTSPYFYYWNGQPGPSGIIVSPTQNTTYNIFVIDNNGCYSDTNHVIVNIIPPVVLTMFASNDSICSGSPVYLTATASGGDGGPYTLYNNSGLIISIPYEINPSFTQDHIFYAKDNTCSNSLSSDTILITVLPPPICTFSIDIYHGCEPLTSSFHDEENESGASYFWNFYDNYSNSDTSHLQNPIHVYSQSGVYDVSLTITSQYNCVNTTTFSQMVTVYPNPIALFYANEIVGVEPLTVNFMNQSQGAVEFLWTFGDGGISSYNNPIHTYSNNGIYDVSLIATSNHGCNDTLMMSNYITIYNTGITFLEENINIQLYPNPANNSITIEASKNMLIEIINIQGQIVKELQTNNSKTKINLENISSGVYILKAKTDQGIIIKKIIKE